MIETLHRVHSFSLDVSSRAATARRSSCDFSCITYVCIVSVIKTHSIHHRSNHEMIVPAADVVESIRVDAKPGTDAIRRRDDLRERPRAPRRRLVPRRAVSSRSRSRRPARRVRLDARSRPPRDEKTNQRFSRRTRTLLSSSWRRAVRRRRGERVVRAWIVAPRRVRVAVRGRRGGAARGDEFRVCRFVRRRSSRTRRLNARASARIAWRDSWSWRVKK